MTVSDSSQVNPWEVQQSLLIITKNLSQGRHVSMEWTQLLQNKNTHPTTLLHHQGTRALTAISTSVIVVNLYNLRDKIMAARNGQTSNLTIVRLTTDQVNSERTKTSWTTLQAGLVKKGTSLFPIFTSNVPKTTYTPFSQRTDFRSRNLTFTETRTE